MQHLSRQKVNSILEKAGRTIRGSRSGSTGVSRAFKPSSAQALLEFALVSIPLLMLMIGIFEFGMAYFDMTKLDTTTREVARRLSVCANFCDYTPKYDLTSNSSVPYDIYALAIITANDYDNPARLEPSNINFIHIQRTDTDGNYVWDDASIPTSVKNAKYVNLGGSQVVGTTKGSDNQYLGLRPYYMRYIYDASKTAVAPFALDTAYVPTGINASQRAYQYRGWPSKGYDITSGYHINGRNICEPTDRFYVQISYRHNWITPLGSLTGLNGGVDLNRQINGKIEAKYYQSSAAAVGLCV